MTRAEFAQIQLGICAAYPKAKMLDSDEAMEVWFKLLEDLDYKVVHNAVMEHISTSVFPPSVAEIRQKCAQRLNPIVTDWGEAWGEVQRAIRKYGSYREEEALESLSGLTAVAVRRMGFKNLCMSENTVADRAHFQRIYEGMVKEEQNSLQLPEFVRTEKQMMIESNTKPAPLLENKEQETGSGGAIPEKQENKGMSEYVESLLDGLRRKMGVR